MLDLAIDPKLAWALQRREAFPVDINRAPRELLLRVPGLGTRAVDRIIVARRLGKLGLGDLAKLTASVRKLLPFIVTPDWRSEEHTSELQSLMRISYAVFCLK